MFSKTIGGNVSVFVKISKKCEVGLIRLAGNIGGVMHEVPKRGVLMKGAHGSG